MVDIMKQLEKLKIDNIMSVLKVIHLNPNISKKNISLLTGLSSTLLTNICNQLKEKKMIIEGNTLVSTKAGRREIALNMNYSLKKVIGVNISSEFCEIVISDLKPALLFYKRVETNIANNKELANSIFGAIETYISESYLSTNDFIGIGISAKGTTDKELGIVGEDFLEEKIKIKEYLSSKINLPIFIENDVKALAIAQNFFFPEDEDFFLIKYSIHGIGGAIFKDGNLYTTKGNAVAKIGHIIIDPTKDYCPVCKRRGCLESLISIQAIKKEIKNSFSYETFPILYKKLNGDFNNFSIEALFESYNEGSIPVNTLIRKSASFMAQSIINVSAILGNSKVILYGDFFSKEEYLFLLEQYIREYQLINMWDKISLSKLSIDQERLASCVIVIKNIFYTELNKYFHII